METGSFYRIIAFYYRNITSLKTFQILSSILFTFNEEVSKRNLIKLYTFDFNF